MGTAVINTRKFIQSLIEAFDNNNVELIISHFADDIVWEIVGEQKLSGKESIREFFNSCPNMQMISSTKDHMVIDGNCVVVNGEVLCEDTEKGIGHNMYYCDIYDLDGGKVKTMTSYCINKKKETTD